MRKQWLKIVSIAIACTCLMAQTSCEKLDTPEEISKEYEDVAKKYNMKVEQVKKFVMENDIKSDIMRRKSVEVLKSNCVQK